MRNALPSISVVMPVYNSEKYVAEAIESILAQTYADFEFIIIDDGSTDSSAAILSEYQKKDERIVLLANSENSGIAVSLNRGIEAARSNLIARMDADDVSLPYRLDLQAGIMNAAPEIVAASGTIEFYETHYLYTPPLSDSEIRCEMLFTPSMCHSAVIMRRDRVLEIGGYRKETVPAEDFDLWTRLARAYPRMRFVNCKECLLKYRLHLGVDRGGYTTAQISNQISLCEEQLLALGMRENEIDIDAHSKLGFLVKEKEVSFSRMAAWVDTLLAFNKERSWWAQLALEACLREKLLNHAPRVTWIPQWMKRFFPSGFKRWAKRLLYLK